MIKFSAWNIDAIGSPLGRQYDNLTRSLDIVGNIPDGWTWDVLLQIGDNLNIISLSPSEEGLHATLTADMLAIKGKYRLQLRASQADKIRHTNIITVDVLESISGDAKWPEVPSEFTQLEQRVRELSEEAGAAAEQAENAAEGVANNAKAAQEAAGQAQTAQDAAAEAVKHYPRINLSTMTWFLWDPEKGEFVDTGVIAEGRNGIEADGLWGVYVDEEGFLVVTYTGDDPPPLSISDDGYLVYTLNGQEIRVGKTVGPEGPAGLGVPEATPEDADKIPIVSPDGTYKLGYQSGAIDDASISTKKTWSSKNIVEKLAPAFESSGPVVTCNPVEGYTLNVVSQIVPVQEGSGDPSPENVRPIKGWAEANLWVGGANIINASDELIIPQDIYSLSISSGNLFDAIKNLPRGKTLYMSWDDVGTNYDQGTSNMISFYNGGSSAGFKIQKNVAFIIPTDGIVYTQLLCYAGTNKTQDAVWSNFRCGPTLESVAEYTPYNSASCTITLPFGQVVYGGTLDWNAGVLTVTHAEIASYSGEALPGAWISDRDVYSQGATPTTGAQVVYELSVPRTIQLTTTEMLALSGTNTIYTDTGDTTVSGRADPNAIIQQLAARIAALEGAATNL